MEIKVCLDNRHFIGKTESNRCLHRKPDIILWSLRSFWVERFDLNQSWKIDYWRKSFLDQCTSLSQNRLFPRSRLGRITYRKLKPYPSWYLLHAPFNWLYPFHQKIEKPTKNHIFSSGCCLINTFNSMSWLPTSAHTQHRAIIASGGCFAKRA